MAPGGSMNFTLTSSGLGAREAKKFELKEGVVIRIGRSPVADFHIEHRGISQYHAELRLLGSNGTGAPRLCVRDLSSNGTGLKRPGTEGDSAQCLKKDADEPLEDGMQLLIPMRLKENHSGRAWITVHFDSAEATDAEESDAPAKKRAQSDSASGSEKEEDTETARKKFVELLLKTREISGSTTYAEAEKLLNHESAWNVCDDATRKECFHIFVDHLGETSSKKKDKKKNKEREKGGKKKEKDKGKEKAKGKDKKRPSGSPDASRRNGKKRGNRRSESGGSPAGGSPSRSPSRRPRRRVRRNRSGSE